MITIVDYGLGNIKAFLNVYSRLNIPATVASTADDLRLATRLILPGVGAFDHAMEKLEGSGMRETLDELVGEKNVPVLGICVGMQILGTSSEEGRLPGLSWIDGRVKRLEESEILNCSRLPHMGWNDVHPVQGSSLFDGLGSASRFYFLHSYYLLCTNDDDVLARTNYAGSFCCAVRSRNIYGVQFHPEKSHHNGMRLLKNFAEL